MATLQNIVISGIFAVVMPAAAMGQEVSSMTAKTPLEVSKVLAEQNGVESKGLQDWYFDRSPFGGFPTAVFAAGKYAAKGNVSPAQYRPSPLKPLTNGKVPLPVSNEKLSSKPGVKQGNLDKLTISPDGNLYKVTNENPWWSFSSERSIQKSVPDADGDMWNKKGEFVGGWKTITKTKTGDFQMIKGKDGQDHFYTTQFKETGLFNYSREIYRDGKLEASFPSSFERNHSYAGEVKPGADEKLYAKYSQKKTEDIILTPESSAQRLKIAARVPVEYREWNELKWKWVKDFDGEGTHIEYYKEHHEERNDISKFEVTSDGKVFTLFKGNVFKDGPNADRKPVAGTATAYVPGKEVPSGGLRDFEIDSNGNLYTVTSWSNKVSVNKADTGVEIGWQKLNVDDSGNVYKTESAGWFHGDYLKKINVLNDPQNASAVAK